MKLPWWVDKYGWLRFLVLVQMSKIPYGSFYSTRPGRCAPGSVFVGHNVEIWYLNIRIDTNECIQRDSVAALLMMALY